MKTEATIKQHESNQEIFIHLEGNFTKCAVNNQLWAGLFHFIDAKNKSGEMQTEVQDYQEY